VPRQFVVRTALDRTIRHELACAILARFRHIPRRCLAPQKVFHG
jgi:hypothetical protein